jgi:iron complex transport system permease protein
MKTREVTMLVGLAAMLAAVFLLSLALGSTPVPLRQVLMTLIGTSPAPDTAAIIVETIRLPRSVTAMLAGAALGIAGLQMQTLFRNPLADPFALGISSGASLGVALVVLGTGYGPATAFGTAMGIRGDALVTMAAIVGAAAVLGLVLIISSWITSPTTVLILGLMFGYAVSAVVTVLIGASQPERLQQWAQWGFGSFSGVTWQRLQLFGPLTLDRWAWRSGVRGG